MGSPLQRVLIANVGRINVVVGVVGGFGFLYLIFAALAKHRPVPMTLVALLIGIGLCVLDSSIPKRIRRIIFLLELLYLAYVVHAVKNAVDYGQPMANHGAAVKKISTLKQGKLSEARSERH